MQDKSKDISELTEKTLAENNSGWTGQGQEQPAESGELDEASLEEVSGGLATNLDSSTNTVSSTSAAPQLGKQGLKNFHCDLSGKSPV